MKARACLINVLRSAPTTRSPISFGTRGRANALTHTSERASERAGSQLAEFAWRGAPRRAVLVNFIMEIHSMNRETRPGGAAAPVERQGLARPLESSHTRLEQRRLNSFQLTWSSSLAPPGGGGGGGDPHGTRESACQQARSAAQMARRGAARDGDDDECPRPRAPARARPTMTTRDDEARSISVVSALRRLPQEHVRARERPARL